MNVNDPHGEDRTAIPATQTEDMQSVDRSPAGFEAKTSSTPSSNEGFPSPALKHASMQPAHQRFVFTDPVAFRYVTGQLPAPFLP
jgi:hypothetical protein